MDKHAITAKWIGDMAFEGNVSGHKITLDKEPGPDSTGLGASPKKLMLLSLAGCTGMDVVSILTKMRVDLKDFNIIVEGDVTDEHPRHYTNMHVIYEFTGKDLPEDKLRKAVELSEERYCGVRAVYVKAIKMSSEIRIIDPDSK
jgi:putative redox protein